MRKKMIADTTALLLFLTTIYDACSTGAEATFRPSQPVPFHASPIFSRSHDEPQTFPPSLQQQQDRLRLRETPLPSGFVPIRTFATPPSQFAPIPWHQGSASLPPSSSPHLVSKTTEDKTTTSMDQLVGQIPSMTKSKKGSVQYPKKWTPEPLDGKKIKQKDVEKRRKQILVATSMIKKNLDGKDAEEEEEGEVEKNKDRQLVEPKYMKMPVGYESQPTLDKVRPQSETTSFEGVESGHFPEIISRELKPYAHNHRQEASGSGFAPLFAAEPSESLHSGSAGFVKQESMHGIGDGSGDRVTFHIHGEKGPKSYRFGYDTGKGHDRHFRYEERDDHGNVKGHFGFYDKQGKLQVVHYSADPKNGYSADGGNFGKHTVL